MSGSSVKGSAEWFRGPTRGRVRPALALMGAVAVSAMAGPLRAENLPDALSKAYFNNPNLNAQRSATRAADENIPIANSGYMPHVAATGDVGAEYLQVSRRRSVDEHLQFVRDVRHHGHLRDVGDHGRDQRRRPRGRPRPEPSRTASATPPREPVRVRAQAPGRPVRPVRPARG